MVAAAKLKTPILIESQVEGYDEIGQPLSTWESIYSCFASVRHLSGKEAIQADAAVSITKASILMRFRSGITPAMRVLTMGLTFNIEAVLPNKAGGEMTLICERVE